MVTLVNMSYDAEVTLDIDILIMTFPIFIKNKYEVINREFPDIIPHLRLSRILAFASVFTLPQHML